MEKTEETMHNETGLIEVIFDLIDRGVVGWVERSETQRFGLIVMGFALLYSTRLVSDIIGLGF